MPTTLPTTTLPFTPTLWLQRHAHPLVAPGICYGRSDMAADDKATQTAALQLVQTWQQEVATTASLWHSPLQRCELLTHAVCALRPDFTQKCVEALAEMDFGAWEGRRWDDIPRPEMDAWTRDFWNYAPGAGESLAQMMTRVQRALNAARLHAQQTHQPVLWITHAGVAQCVHWLITRGDRIPTAKDWPSIKLAYGEWIRLPLR